MWSSTRWRVDRALLPLALTLCLAWSAPVSNGAPAAAIRPVAITPAAAHPHLAGSRLQGEATLRFLGMRIYHARLWTLPDFRPDRTDAQPLVLELEYLRELKGSAIAERSLNEMRRAGNFSEAQAQRWLAQMQRIFPDVKAGDRLTGQRLLGQGVGFWHNDRPAGLVDDAEFAQRFFGIWLAPTTSEPEMRQALLGLNERERR